MYGYLEETVMDISKCVAFVLITVCIFLTVSCSSGEVTESFTVDYNDFADDSGSPTFGGEHIVTRGFGGADSTCGYLENTEFYDLALKRLSDVEKKLDISIDITTATDFQSLILSGTFFADAIMNSSFGMVGPVRAGLFVDLSDVIDVTDTEKYGNPTQILSSCWTGGQYGVIPVSWPEAIYNTINFLLAVNENLAGKMALADPRDYAEQGKWTWDTFESYIKEATQNTGDKTVYGISIHSPHFAEMYCRSAGENLYYMDENGNVCVGWYRSTDAVSALIKAQNFRYGDCEYCFYPSDNVTEASEAFINGDAVISTVGGGVLLGKESSIMFLMDEIGFVQYPYLSSKEESLYSVHEGMDGMTYIPVNTNDIDATGAFLSAVFEPLDGYETRDAVRDYLNRNLFFDDRDTTLFLSMIDRSYYTFFIDGARALEERVIGYEQEPQDAFQTLEALRNKYDIILEKNMIPTFDGLKTIWSPEQIRSFYNMH